MMKLNGFPFYRQLDAVDCGPACLRMIAKFYGKNYSLPGLRTLSGIGKQGVSMLGISEAAEAIGFRTLAVTTTLEKICEQDLLPCIAHWSQNHFVIIYKIKKNKVYVADPGKALLAYPQEEFMRKWSAAGTAQGIVLLLEPGPKFYEKQGDQQAGISFSTLFSYLWSYKKLLVQLVLGFIAGTVLQLIFPFLTQAIVDVGIETGDLQFIYIILAAQLMLFLGQASVDFVRNWILLHINTRINISILSDFLVKLMKLPIGFFDSKRTGDILQRMQDQQRIQDFLTGPTLSTLFSFVSFAVFSIVILFYNVPAFVVFLAGSIVYVAWVMLFLNYRRKLDYRKFEALSQNQGNLVQLVQGMQEIKMNNCETTRRWQWERIQAKVFRINIRSLSLRQYQQGGAIFINQVKNIVIIYFSATAVLQGELTLGSMLAIQYMIGQLNAPLEQFIEFIQSMQDAKISMERLNEIHYMEDEEPANAERTQILPHTRDIVLEDVSFRYAGAGNPFALQNISLEIPQGKLTAIVGMSGSGKTTLLKLLMKFYEPETGTISLDGTRLQSIANKTWRSKCGVVMQDSFIFTDTIANNIAVSDEYPDPQRLEHAVNIANLHEFISSLPLKLETVIGPEGSGISQGQRQRILIARAVYKDPEFIFFDEATNALDTNNERLIMQNLDTFFKGRTVVVAAHRLSTVKDAAQIIVLDKGRIIEKGTHDQLVKMNGAYLQLVSNQLQLTH